MKYSSRSVRRASDVTMLAAMIALVSCDQPRASHVTVSDSAGVSIVASTEAALAAADEWKLGNDPVLTIGGSIDDELAGITSAVRLRDGRIAVANAMASQLWLYSPKGELITMSGRTGEGPGEYRFIAQLCRLGADSIAAWDPSLGRLTVLSPHGELSRTHTVTVADNVGSQLNACTGTAHVLVGPEDRYKERDMNQVRRDTLPLFSFNTQAGTLDSIGVFPGEVQYEMYVPPVILLEPAPFGAATSFAANSRHVFVADNGRTEVRVFGMDGTLARIIRFEREPTPVTLEDRRQFREANVDEGWRPSYLAAKRAFVDKAPIPETMPYFGGIVLDEAGRLWVSSYSSPYATDPQPGEWLIFSNEGRPVARMSSPAAFRVMRAGDDWVLGVASDSLDIEQIRMYRIVNQ